MLAEFHFLHPLFLWALVPLAFILWYSLWQASSGLAWEKVIDPQLLSFLLQGKGQTKGRWVKWVLAFAWLLSVIALADPVWEKIPRPVFQTNSARVIVLDLSNSMLIDDLNPARLARARFKVEDILAIDEEGQIGLVVFAGSAFTASPLARDPDTIRSLLQVLTPDIMPSQGSRADLGLEKALELLKQSNISHGQILLIADGVSEPQASMAVADKIKAAGHTVSVLGVGTKTGGKLNFRNRPAVTVMLEADTLKQIAQRGGGRYHTISTDDSDLNNVMIEKNPDGSAAMQTDTLGMTGQDWKSTGPFMIFLLIPLAALAFRKGWLLQVALMIGVASLLASPKPAMAANWEENVNTQWEKLWLNKEQRADKAFDNKQYNEVITLTAEPLKRGNAAYKNGDYQAAVDNFQQLETADAFYNAGNALAQMKKYQEAINAYDQALAIQANMADAIANKEVVAQLLEQQPQDQKQEGGEGDPSENEEGEKGEPSEEQEPGDQDSEQSESDQQGEQAENQFDEANKKQDASEEPEEQAEEGEKPEPDASESKGAETSEQASARKEEEAEALSKEEKLAAEQWLRRIPDDPGGLLRNKFLWQYKRQKGSHQQSENPW